MRKLILALSIFICAVSPVYAQETSEEPTYEVQYDFNFFVDDSSSDINVELDITLTNLRSDVYINEYSMSFPQNFLIRNLRVTDAKGTVPYVVAERDRKKTITFRFEEPEDIGAFSQNNLTLKYKLEDMHSSEGRVNEFILPLLVSDPEAVVNATLNLPQDFDKKISISKPVPSEVTIGRILWRDVNARTILTLFGESQVYSTRLSYSLANTSIRPEKRTIALPPETLFQKVYLNSLDPQPSSAFTDDDGNYLAEYTVPPRSTLDITFDGFVEVFVRPQSSLRNHFRREFEKQKRTLLSPEEQWQLGDALRTIPLETLTEADDVYSFTVDTLSYSLDRLDTDTSRFGAEKALAQPHRAVCMEYTDLFIALAREKGIPAREIQGYGYSESQRIRPQSLVLDELHAWPEFYNEAQEIWVQVDPTWEDTSGIDYFSGFDVNHIALAIHGEDPITPLPAGFYKTAPTQDVLIDISSTKPSSEIDLDINHTLKSNLIVGKEYSSTVTVKNIGNVFVHDIHIVPESKNITVHSGPINVQYLAPFESKEYPITYTVTENFSPSDTLSFVYEGDVLGAHDVRIVSQGAKNIRVILIFGAITVILFSAYLFIRSKRA